MNAFRDINIFPSYSRKAAVVAWIVDPAIRDAEFYVYRSEDGTSEYELLNDDPVFGCTFTDTTLQVRNKLQIPYYRVLAILNGKEYESPVVALYDRVGREAYGVSHCIISEKYIQARQDGIPVLYYPLARNGKTNEALDPDTGQRIKATCPASSHVGGDGEEGNDDYGTYYADGYCRPFITYIRLLGGLAQKTNVLDVGVMDSSVQLAEFLAFPFPRTDDMVVDAATDRRWKIGDLIQTHLVKGIIPVGHNAKISLQPHNDPCYAVPIPDNYKALVDNLLWPEIR